MSRRSIVLVLALASLVPTLAPAGAVAPLVPDDLAADFVWDPQTPRSPDTVTLQSLAHGSAPIVRRAWSIETMDGTLQASGETAEVVFGRPGAYVATHSVTDALLRTAEVTRTIVVERSPPVADLIAPAEPVFRGLAVSFADNSTDVDGDAIVAREWDFGDGASATGASAEHAYATLGSFVVTLTVTDAGGDTASASRIVRVLNQPPTVLGDIAPRAPVVGENVTFIADGIDPDQPGGALAYGWSFSDGVTLEGQAVTRVFAARGNYSATLRATDEEGATSAPFVIGFHVDAAAPVAAFTFSPSVPVRDELVQFTDASSSLNGPIVQWRWDFGDGSTSTRASPVHSFARNGTFVVRLQVVDAAGRAGAAEQDVFVNARPVAAFAATSPVPLGAPVAFEDRSTDVDGSVVEWAWAFGDGSVSLERHPTHTYGAPGAYAVTLTVRDDLGATSSATRIVDVANTPPVALWTMDAGGAPQVGVPITFDGSPSYDPDGQAIASYAWTLGDGTPTARGATVSHAFARSGLYAVGLTVDDGTRISARTPDSHRVVRVEPAHDVVVHVFAQRPDGSQVPLAGGGYAVSLRAADGSEVPALAPSPDGNGLAVTIPRSAWVHGMPVVARVDAERVRGEVRLLLQDGVTDITAAVPLPLPLEVEVAPARAVFTRLAEAPHGTGRVLWSDGAGVENASVTVEAGYVLRGLVDVGPAQFCEATTTITGASFEWRLAPESDCLATALGFATPGRWEVRAIAVAYDARGAGSAGFTVDPTGGALP